MNTRHHDHSRRVILTIGFAATLIAAVSNPHDHGQLPTHQPLVQVASH